jgi:hypothetical protein
MEVIQNRDHWVLHRLQGFYSNEENFKKVQSILSGESRITSSETILIEILELTFGFMDFNLLFEEYLND